MGIDLIKQAILKDKNVNVSIQNPKRGEKFELIQIVQSNLDHTINSYLQAKRTNKDLLIDMLRET